MNEPKACQLCGFCDTLGVCATCPNDGEASWSPLVPTFVPVLALETVLVDDEPAVVPVLALETVLVDDELAAAPSPAPKSKAKGRK